MPLSTLRVVALGATHPPRSTQLRRQLLLQHAAGLDEEAAIDRFVRYLHVLVGWELLLQPVGDLLRRPLQRELLRHAPSGTVRNSVCEAIMMEGKGASYGNRERP